MTRFQKMRRVLSYVWLAYCLVLVGLGLSDSPERELTEKNKKEIGQTIKPAVFFIDSIQNATNQLPDSQMFDKWQREKELSKAMENGAGSKTIDCMKNAPFSSGPVRYIRNNRELGTKHPAFLRAIDWHRSYVLADWTGYWDVYYSSCDKKYIAYDRIDNGEVFDNIFLLILIGLLPLGIGAFVRVNKLAKIELSKNTSGNKNSE